MRILLAGHTGLAKADIVERIKSAPRILNNFSDIWGNRGEFVVQAYPAEGRLAIDTALTAPNDLLDLWYSSFQQCVVEPWKKAPANGECISIVTMHLAWLVKSQFLSPLLSHHRPAILKFLRDKFKPDYIFTLIDNVYTCQSRITQHELTVGFRLAEILRWRNIETILADTLSENVITHQNHDRRLYRHERSPILSVNQQLETFFRYILQPKTPRVYLSYPITAPRALAARTGSTQPIDEINHFRHHFSTIFTAFDPLTIDERPLAEIPRRYEKKLITTTRAAIHSVMMDQSLSQIHKSRELLKIFKDSREDAQTTLKKSDLWPRQGEELTSLNGASQKDVCGLSLREVIEVTEGVQNQHSEIDRQIQTRDFRLIDQADCVITYRPTYDGRPDWSGGTAAEVRYALAEHKPVFIIADKDNDSSLNEPPFGPDLPRHMRFEVKNLADKKMREKVFEDVQKRVASRVKNITDANQR